jgi:hypothetical protein
MAQKFMLTDIQVKAFKPGEKLRRVTDGGGLFLTISPAGNKWWEYRYRFQGKDTSIGLGSYPMCRLPLPAKSMWKPEKR